jgi:diguanylate cyclase (GGDEF)-like protein
MVETWLKTPEWARAAVASLLCLGLFASDLFTSVEMNESQLYPVAMMLLYRIRAKPILWLVGGLAIALTVAGYAIVPPVDVWDGVTNRVFAIAVIVITMLGMTKLAQYEHRLLLESMTDPLTGLLNRRYFNELSGKEVTRARRHGLAFAVLMLDIDHFKRINDKFGHPVGDIAIKAVADACNVSLRPHDLLARYGGEEFVLMLPHTDEEGARVVAERIRQLVEAIDMATANGPLRFTVSVGISIYQQGAALDQVVGRADEALYKAKQSGRNRVVSLPFERGMVPA